MKEKTIGGVNLKNWTLCFLCTLLLAHSIELFANNIPSTSGSDPLKSLTAASHLLGIIDSAIFKFGARILAGLCIIGAGWNLKEQRFAMAIVCIFGAILIGTTPMWIKNIFALNSNGGGSIFP